MEGAGGVGLERLGGAEGAHGGGEEPPRPWHHADPQPNSHCARALLRPPLFVSPLEVI